MIPALKAANPGLKVLVYKNLTFTVSYGCRNGTDLPYQTTGVGYCDADQHHPDWFLTDPSGNRLNSSGYPQALDHGRGQRGLSVEMGDATCSPTCARAAGTASSWTTRTPTWAGT